MCDGFKQWVYRRKRDCWFLYRWSCHRSHSWSGRKWKSRKRTLASHDSIAKENHRYVAYIALKRKRKKIINRCFIRHVLFSETKRDHFIILKIWIHFFFFFFFLFHFVVVLSDYRRRIQSDNNINNRYMVYMNNSNVTYMKSFLWIYSKSLTNKKIAKKHCRYLFQRFIRIPESSWTVNILLLPNFL